MMLMRMQLLMFRESFFLCQWKDARHQIFFSSMGNGKVEEKRGA